MMIRLLIGVCLVMLASSARPAEPELMVALSVMGYGYKVKINVNGADIGVEGGKSEGRRLFNKGHEMAAKATPSLRARNFVLVPGANVIAIDYAKVDSKSNDQLEITLEAQGYPQPLLRLNNKTKSADKLVVKIDISEKASADFKTVVIPDSK